MVPTSAAADSALERRILKYLMSVNAHTIRLGISFDRPAITSGRKTVVVGEVSVMVCHGKRDEQRLPNCYNRSIARRSAEFFVVLLTR